MTVLKCQLWTNVLVLLIDLFHDDIPFICFSIYVNEPLWSHLKQTIIVLYFAHANEIRKANFHTYKRSMMSSLLILKDDFDVQFCRVQIFQCVVYVRVLLGSHLKIMEKPPCPYPPPPPPAKTAGIYIWIVNLIVHVTVTGANEDEAGLTLFDTALPPFYVNPYYS